MSNKAYRAGIISFSLVVTVILYQVYITLAAPQVPYMDTMLFFVQIDKILTGRISWLDIYGSGEHRGLIYPFITFLEWKLWGVDARITTMLTGIVVAAIFYFWLSALLNAQSSQGNQNKTELLKVFIFCVIAAAIIVSPAGFELWTLDLGFAQLVKNLFIVHFLYLLSVSKWWTKNLLQALILSIYGGFLIIFATYGWSYPFFIACLFAIACSLPDAPEARKQAALVAVVLLLAQLVYVYTGHGVFSQGKAAGVDISIISLVGGVLYGAATAFIGGEVLEKHSLPLAIPLILGALALVAALLAIFITVIERTKEKIFLSSVLMFSLAVLAGVAVARGIPDFTKTGSSRYFVDYVWILLAPLAIIFTTRLTQAIPQSSVNSIASVSLYKLLPMTKLLAYLLLIAAVIGHSITWISESKTAPYRAVVFKNMAEVYRWGVTNEIDAALLQSPFPVAQRAVVVAQSHNLAVLGKRDVNCVLESAAYKGDWYAAETNGARWMGRQGLVLLANCAGTVTVKGYIPVHFKQRNVSVSYGGRTYVIAVEAAKEFSLRLEGIASESMILTLEVDRTTSPLLEGLGADERELGFLLTYIGE